jgi:hypothetical protein
VAVHIDLDRLTRSDGCDRCGVDELGRPLGPADLAVTTPKGPLLLCRIHHHQSALALFRQRCWVRRLPADEAVRAT